MRVKIWRDLLKVDISEYEENRVLRRKYANNNYDSNKSVYCNYRDIASRMDCLAFR